MSDKRFSSSEVAALQRILDVALAEAGELTPASWTWLRARLRSIEFLGRGVNRYEVVTTRGTTLDVLAERYVITEKGELRFLLPGKTRASRWFRAEDWETVREVESKEPAR